MKDTSRYKGLTKKKYKKLHNKSTPGITKTETCRATGLDKALAKYPRSHKTMTDLYISFNQKKDKAARRENTCFTKPPKS